MELAWRMRIEDVLTGILGFKFVQFAQSQFDLWWDLRWLFSLLFHFGGRPLFLALVARAILSAGFCGLCLLLWSRRAGSTRLVFFFSYYKLGVKL
jgi:hypothetical protein